MSLFRRQGEDTIERKKGLPINCLQDDAGIGKESNPGFYSVAV
jgi:hypothetical protein